MRKAESFLNRQRRKMGDVSVDRVDTSNERVLEKKSENSASTSLFHSQSTEKKEGCRKNNFAEQSFSQDNATQNIASGKQSFTSSHPTPTSNSFSRPKTAFSSSSTVVQPKKNSIFFCVCFSIALLIGGVILFSFVGNKGDISLFVPPGRDSASILSQIAEDKGQAVGLVVLKVERKDGKIILIPMGTAWAFSSKKFATNAHVAYGLRECYKENQKYIAHIEALILINNTNQKSYRICSVRIHRGYSSGGFSPDVAELSIDGAHDKYFKIANKSTLARLKPGEPIAYLGFPIENLAGGNVNLSNPIATMQTGVLSSMTSFNFTNAGMENNYLIRHNLPATGGASGSPIFNRSGEVIALLCAGNTIGQVNGKRVERAPSAAQVNFGIRADLLKEVGYNCDINTFIKQ